MAEIYRLKVAGLKVALNDDSIKAEAGEVLRSLIDRVVLTPAIDAPDGIEAQLHGDLAAILALSSDGGRKQRFPANGMAGSLLSLVAGVGVTVAGSPLSLVAGGRNHLDLLLSTRVEPALL